MPIHLPIGGSEASQPVDLSTLVVEKAADSIFVLDAEGRTVYANSAAERTFGWTREELAGKLLHDLVHHHRPDGRPYPMSECPLGHVFGSGTQLEKHEDMFFRRDGTPIHVACSNAPLEHEGRMVGAVLIAVDITERKRIEERLAEALAAKDGLIKEVHHRVKNSLMMAIGLLRLQAQEVADATARRQLEDACARVATAARMHEHLHRVEDLETVEFSQLLKELCEQVVSTSQIADRVAFEFNAEPMVLRTDLALPLALVANELVVNAFKHAFRDGRAGRIQVRFGPAGEGWSLQVSDDGVGLPEDVDWTSSRSLGTKLVYGLSRQIAASVTLDRTAGSTITVSSAQTGHDTGGIGAPTPG